MTLNKAQFEQFVCNYVQHIVDGLDTETLECMVTDLLVREYDTYTEDQIIAEIDELYGADMVAELVPAEGVPVS